MINGSNDLGVPAVVRSFGVRYGRYLSSEDLVSHLTSTHFPPNLTLCLIRRVC